MNLESFLNYRTHCICGHELVLEAVTKRITLQQTNDSLNIIINKKKLISLNFDNTFISHNDVDNSSIFNFAINIVKKCPLCFRNQDDPRSFGNSSLIETMYNQYYHYLAILPQHNNKTYYFKENCEFISLINDNYLYHTETSFLLNKTQIYYGYNLDSMFSQVVPRLNNQAVKSKDAFVSKIKMLIAFS